MNRRDFLLTGSAALGAFVVDTNAEEPPRKLRIGFLGVSHSHAAQKVKLVQQSPDWTLVGICEDAAPLRDNYGKQGIRQMSQEELLRECEVVAVESAVRDHVRHAKLALEAGLHLHLEKPPAHTLVDFVEIQRLAKEKQRLLQVGYMWRFNPGINAVLEAAKKGWLGDVHLVRATINTSHSPATRREVAEFPGGTLFELGCHVIDPIVRLLGRPTEVISHLQKHGNFDDALKDNTTAILQYPRATAIVTSLALQPNAGAHRSVEIIGSNGVALLEPIEQPTLTLDLAKPAGPYRAGARTISFPRYERFTDEFAALAAAVRDGQPLAVTPEEELLVQETLLRACKM
ncbi:Gfo/Idh/MocA family protein [Verrucomicrobiota bacterium sgz303538]